MSTVGYTGNITKWDDSRGFGFITPEYDSEPPIFVHISAFGKVARRPVIGDKVTYQLTTQADGRIQAILVKIEGVELKKAEQRMWYDWVITGMIGLLILIFIGIGFIFIQADRPSTSPPLLISIKKPGCIIKGNISINSGAKYYHVPGMENYETTVISPKYGEQWFCSESEARAAGWQKATK